MYIGTDEHKTIIQSEEFKIHKEEDNELHVKTNYVQDCKKINLQSKELFMELFYGSEKVLFGRKL